MQVRHLKHHIMISLGVLMGAIFSLRMANALITPGIGILEGYLAGGLVIAAALIFSGLKARRHARQLEGNQEAQSSVNFNP